LCKPGQIVVAPISGKYVRPVRPYADDYELTGMMIKGNHVMVKLLYVEPSIDVGNVVAEGQAIGIAQDVTKRYDPEKMKPHVHMTVYVDPNHIMEILK
jgi:hypothetical protein